MGRSSEDQHNRAPAVLAYLGGFLVSWQRRTSSLCRRCGALTACLRALGLAFEGHFVVDAAGAVRG